MGRDPLKVLVLTFYYRPDLSAGSFRVTPLVAALRRELPPGSQVDVVTTLPNRYGSFTADAPRSEQESGLSIYRLALGRHKSGMLDQSVAFTTFARGALARTRASKYDVVFATSSRLMTAALGARIAGRVGARLYLDIRDIFADTIPELLAQPLAPLARKLFSTLEAYAIRRADKISIVSAGFAEYFAARYPTKRFECFTNGVDDEFMLAGPAMRSPSPRLAGPDTISVVYAGNLGEGQGLHAVIPRLARALGCRVHFRLIGDGGRREALAAAVEAARVPNVELLPPIGRERLINAYHDADVLFLHLNDYAAFRKVLPSKLFEYAAMGKPVWAGVSGFAAQFVRSEIPNAAVFPPGDIGSAIRSLDALVLEDSPRAAFLEKYGRKAISHRLAQDILSIVR